MTVGRRETVVDARDRVRGRVPYVLDEVRPAMLHGRIVRSTVAHGRILSIDASAAWRVPGVVAVITGADVPGAPDDPAMFGELVRDTPVLAVDRVRYVGEPVAAVAATDPDAAEEAAGLVVVAIDPLPAILSIDDALMDGAPVIDATGDVIAERHLHLGDVDTALAAAHIVVDETFVTAPVQGVPLEAHTVLAEASDDGIVVHTATQTPFHVQADLAAIFGFPIEQVRVVVRTLGGGFGAKAYSRIEPLAVLLARRAGRPVKFVLSRGEEFVTVHRQSAVIHFITGVSRDGRIVAMRGDCVFGAGPYVDNTPRVVRHGLYSMPGPYRIDHLDLHVRGQRTNTPPCGPLRAPGTAQVQWAREAHLEGIAAALRIDPLELRRRNLVTSGDRFVLGGPMGDVHLAPLLEAVRFADETLPPPINHGLRIGTGYGVVLKTTQTPSTSAAAVVVGVDGIVSVKTSTVEMGQGARTVIAQLAGETLHVPPACVDVTMPDTATTPPDQGTLSSRSTFSMGRAVVLAAQAVRDRLLEIGERVLEIDRRDLRMVDGSIVPVGGPGTGKTFAELINAAGLDMIREEASFTNEPMRDEGTGEVGVSTHYHQAAAGARVAVDTETGAVSVLEVRAATHAGMVVNPTLAELQIEGNITFGVGQALMEEIVMDGGQVQNGSLADYMIPSILDMPVRVTVALTEDDTGEIHGIGETALPAVVPAITNAISDALGARIRQIPATPERIVAASRDSHAAR